MSTFGISTKAFSGVCLCPWCCREQSLLYGCSDQFCSSLGSSTTSGAGEERQELGEVMEQDLFVTAPLWPWCYRGEKSWQRAELTSEALVLLPLLGFWVRLLDLPGFWFRDLGSKSRNPILMPQEMGHQCTALFCVHTLVGQIWPNLSQLQREEESARGISVGLPASQFFSSQGTEASVLPSGDGFLEGKVRLEFGSFPERSDSNPWSKQRRWGRLPEDPEVVL